MMILPRFLLINGTGRKKSEVLLIQYRAQNRLFSFLYYASLAVCRNNIGLLNNLQIALYYAPLDNRTIIPTVLLCGDFLVTKTSKTV